MYSRMANNSNFIREVSSHFRKDDEIIVVGEYLLKSLSSTLFLALLLNSDFDLSIHRGANLVKKRFIMAAIDLLAAVSIFFLQRVNYKVENKHPSLFECLNQVFVFPHQGIFHLAV